MNVLENVRLEIKKLVPLSVLSDIACFVFYDHHPRGEKNIDITVVTKNGELREYFLRDLQSSLNLNCVIQKPCDLKIIRNKNSELFYLLAVKDELYIISSKDKLQVYKKFINIDRYDVNDTTCNGETFLKIIKKDDAVPLMFDSNFDCLEDSGVISSQQNAENSFPILNELKRKLVEARYAIKCNEKTYAHYLNLHQKASLLTCQNQQPADNSVFQTDVNSISGALKLKPYNTFTKVCNKKLVIIINVVMQHQESIKNIHLLFNHKTIPSLVYTTKIFTKVPTPPYWQEAQTNAFELGQECAITAVVDLEELKENVTSRIELSGSIAYEMLKQEILIPFDDVIISSMEMMGDEIYVLSSKTTDRNSIIAVLAATEKTELCLRHIQEDDDPDISTVELFCTHLHMDRVDNASNVIIHRKSPFHALNGTMLVFHERNSDNAVPVSVHTRTPSQVVTLLHCICDAMPAKIVVTTATYKITSKTEDHSHYNENISNKTQKINYTNYATSMLNRSTKILEHLDRSMIKMNESKNPSIQSKVGTHIDLFACGIDEFKELKECLLVEAVKGVNVLTRLDSVDGNTQEVIEAEQEVDLNKSHGMDLDEDTGSDVIFVDQFFKT